MTMVMPERDNFVSSLWNRFALAAFVWGLVVLLADVVVFTLCALFPNADTAVGALHWFITSLVLSIPPVVFGHLALLERRRDLRGRGIGIAGLSLAYAGIFVGTLGCALVITWFLLSAASCLLYQLFDGGARCASLKFR